MFRQIAASADFARRSRNRPEAKRSANSARHQRNSGWAGITAAEIAALRPEVRSLEERRLENQKKSGREHAAIGALSGLIIALAATIACPSAQAQNGKIEHPNLNFVVAGTSSTIYFTIPALARSLGYFKDEGLNVEWIDFGLRRKGASGACRRQRRRRYRFL